MILGLAMIPLLSCVVLFLKPFSRFNRRISVLRNKLYTSLFWSQQITLLNESFSMICMCAFINVLHITFDSKCETINSILAITFMILCCTLPIIICVFLLARLPYLGTDPMKRKFGAFTEGLNLEQGRLILLTPINFLLRRFLITASVVVNNMLML